jgi:multiple sugar transport system substrate-binding protein
MLKRASVLLSVVVVLAMLATQFGVAFAVSPAADEPVKELTIIFAQWDPANYLQQLCDEYTKESGVKIKVVQEPWSSYGDRVFAEFAAKGTAYDMVVSDSQWMGQGAMQGHYMELTDIFNTELNGKAFLPSLVSSYAEYPPGSGRYWSVPTEGDAMIWAYRKDLFEDPAEKTAFKAKYGYDLAVPDTWDQLKDIAAFFTRPDKNFYGLGIQVSKDYDCLCMGIENVFFSYGAAWGDYKTNKAEGIVNSPQAVKAIEFYKSLRQYMPPGSGNMCWQEINDAFVTGQVAMALNFVGWMPGLVNPAMSKYAAGTSFFIQPKGPTGERKVSLGGQALAVVNYISDAHKKASVDFLKWFAKDENQVKWYKLGGFTCNANVMKTPEYLAYAPFNKPFADSLALTSDFWRVPPYAELLTMVQTTLNSYVVGDQGTAQSTLDAIAKASDKILKDAGLQQ